MTKTKLKPVPRSKATTGWELCKDVIKVIKAEPKRVDMGTYHQSLSPRDGGPACGMVGCFGGWVSLMAPGRWHRQAPETILGHGLNYHTVGVRPTRYGDENSYVFNAGHGDACNTTTPSTAAHMRAVVRRIEKFMKVNETALKARELW